MCNCNEPTNLRISYLKQNFARPPLVPLDYKQVANYIWLDSPFKNLLYLKKFVFIVTITYPYISCDAERKAESAVEEKARTNEEDVVPNKETNEETALPVTWTNEKAGCWPLASLLALSGGLRQSARLHILLHLHLLLGAIQHGQYILFSVVFIPPPPYPARQCLAPTCHLSTPN